MIDSRRCPRWTSPRADAAACTGRSRRAPGARASRSAGRSAGRRPARDRCLRCRTCVVPAPLSPGSRGSARPRRSRGPRGGPARTAWSAGRARTCVTGAIRRVGRSAAEPFKTVAAVGAVDLLRLLGAACGLARPRSAVCSPSHRVPSERSLGSGSTSTTPTIGISRSASCRATVCSHAVFANPARTTSSVSPPRWARSVHAVPAATEPTPIRASPAGRRLVSSAPVTRTGLAVPVGTLSAMARAVSAVSRPGRRPRARPPARPPARWRRPWPARPRASARRAPAPTPVRRRRAPAARASRRPACVPAPAACARHSRAGPRSRAGSCAITDAPRLAEMSLRSTGLSLTTPVTAASVTPRTSPSAKPMAALVAPATFSDTRTGRGASTIWVPADTRGAPRPACWACCVSWEIWSVSSARRA